MKFNIGGQYYKGEFKIHHLDKNGNLIKEYDWQDNLFLENGLKTIFSDWKNNPPAQSSGIETSFGSYPPQYLIIGTGNSEPNVNQIALDNATHYSNWNNENGTEFTYEDPNGSTDHEGYVKLSTTFKYSYNNFTEPLNITEIGLASGVWEWNNLARRRYSLCTRALIKDTSNTPVAITVLAGEILQVWYKISVYVDIRRKTGEFTLTKTDAGNITTTDTFEYFIQPYDVFKNAKHYGNIWSEYDGHYYKLSTAGVKETDEELDASYNLNDEIYNSINFNDISPINEKIINNGWKESDNTYNNGNTLYSDYAIQEVLEHNYQTKRHTIKRTMGINTHNHENGIRAFVFQNKINVYGSSIGNPICKYLVVVKNKANGQGIKKLNTYTWTVEHTTTIGRWEGD